MKIYEVKLTEKLMSTVQVEAESEDEAYEKAQEILSESFDAPYHDECNVIDYKIKELN